ncbi:MAG: hypothetical protein ABIO73_20175, partial [Polaromonas sp.]
LLRLLRWGLLPVIANRPGLRSANAQNHQRSRPTRQRLKNRRARRCAPSVKNNHSQPLLEPLDRSTFCAATRWRNRLILPSSFSNLHITTNDYPDIFQSLSYKKVT